MRTSMVHRRARAPPSRTEWSRPHTRTCCIRRRARQREESAPTAPHRTGGLATAAASRPALRRGVDLLRRLVAEPPENAPRVAFEDLGAIACRERVHLIDVTPRVVEV